MSNKKIKEFLSEKLNNFKTFINNEFMKLTPNFKLLFCDKVDALNKDLNFYTINIDVFISTISALNYSNPHECVKVFLSQYNIDVSIIKDKIDYDKLIRYIEMFNEVIKK